MKTSAVTGLKGEKMREIKFKGFSKKLNKWIYGDLIQSGSKSYIAKQGFLTPYECLGTPVGVLGFENNEDIFEVEPGSIGQYTGLKDKNGKEIYEGDIVECVSCKEKDRKYKVAWCDKFLGFILEHKKEKYQISIFNDFKIIGNVFENPELLEQEK